MTKLVAFPKACFLISDHEKAQGTGFPYSYPISMSLKSPCPSL